MLSRAFIILTYMIRLHKHLVPLLRTTYELRDCSQPYLHCFTAYKGGASLDAKLVITAPPHCAVHCQKLLSQLIYRCLHYRCMIFQVFSLMLEKFGILLRVPHICQKFQEAI